jgi:hypothetical protein
MDLYLQFEDYHFTDRSGADTYLRATAWLHLKGAFIPGHSPEHTKRKQAQGVPQCTVNGVDTHRDWLWGSPTAYRE